MRAARVEVRWFRKETHMSLLETRCLSMQVKKTTTKQNNSLHLAQKYARIFVRGRYRSEKRHAPGGTYLVT